MRDMKMFLMTAIVVTGAVHCWGNLGETPEEIRKRFGQPIQTGETCGFPTEVFHVGGCNAAVTYQRGKSACEVITIRDETTKMTDADAIRMMRDDTGIYQWEKLDGDGFVNGVRRRANGEIQTAWACPSCLATRLDNSKKTISLIITSLEFAGDWEKAKPNFGGKNERMDVMTKTNGMAAAPVAGQKAAAAVVESKAPSATDVATFKFHSRQAAAGNVGSMYRLGQLYLEGKGCDTNTNQAKIWFQKAADQGNAEAKQALEDLK